MLNVLGVTSWRTPLGFDRRFRKLHFGMEKDPPDARRLLFASWVMFVSLERFSVGVRRVALFMAIWVRSSANTIPLFDFVSPVIGSVITHPLML